ncbi:NAD(P)/FAD-dependent oxidoreductase [Roseateles depolymerans]|uniref:Uncharacterized protein n=1 Tax=Roseateles depolymerans TaxID=76731 RepID=A0A0U3D080_9BURK|nr:NAD(P)-binding protein [Roseateles depolymerans]ALV06998.1 hypothetical protein RD2015_2532 [Roseateles depolymerans]REG19980.1 hypothetical protein DES44_2486 [Roseateles depolymerans]
MLSRKPASIAVIGAGIAGAACAQALHQAGHAVQVFDKSRGAGGRLATRRFEWIQENGSEGRARLDHGALGFVARSEVFRAFVQTMQDKGLVAPWQPALAPDSLALEQDLALYVVTPEMPLLCKHLLADVPAQWSFALDRLTRDATGWRLHAGGQVHPDAFDAVVLAIPPAQAAPLLNGLRDDWARFASLVPMQPCWTLMGVAREEDASAARESQWSLARPELGPLAWVIRNDRRPGRAADPGHAHWVVHARAGWSRLNLEQDAGWVKHQLCTALEVFLGHEVRWAHAVVHRWRYALPPLGRTPAHPLPPAPQHWWDERLGLGVCGDLFTANGMEGVEGAYLSALALVQALHRSAEVDVAATKDMA